MKLKLGKWETVGKQCYNVKTGSKNQGKLQYITTELQFQAETAVRRESIYKRYKQAKLFYTMQQCFFSMSALAPESAVKERKGQLHQVTGYLKHSF